MLRRLVVATLAGALLLCAMPARAFAASDDWRPLDGHYRCVWHCRERARLFRTSPKPVTPKAAPARRAPAFVDRAPAADRGSGSGFGPFSWLTSLFGDRSWRTSTRYDDHRYGDDWGYRNNGWGWGGRRGEDDWWSWDNGRDSGYSAHRHHPRGGDY